MFMLPMFLQFSLTGGGDTGSSQIDLILTLAGKLMTWVIEKMGDIVDFAVSNPITLIAIAILFCSFAGGFLYRLLKSFSTR